MVRVRPIAEIPFVPAECLPPGKDEHYLRFEQFGRGVDWRPLRHDEIEALKRNDNRCRDWNLIQIGGAFDPALIRNSEFAGLVRILQLEPVMLEHHDLEVPAGILNSRIVSCDLGANIAIRNVGHLARYILGDRVMLLHVDEMHCTNHARFGNGIVKDGQSEDDRIVMDLMNEAGGRGVPPFQGMRPADAYLWARHRDDRDLLQRLTEITQQQFDARRGFYGTVGCDTVIKSTRTIKDVRIGDACYIKGANKLKNLTIESSEKEPTQIGEGVELVDGIVSRGCRIYYGCKAVRFVMGAHAQLKYGARLIHSYLGDNSTVSCCELLNNLIFPAHEQHHNNSFLIASLLMGQSNIAAGATIGSNHNSRANDGEIIAGRGFWPGLCVSLKHCSRFASYTLLAKGDYPAELDVPLPFSLVSNDAAGDRLVLLPAYWWLYNMYALARNNWKFAARDRRLTPGQHIETHVLAPDTVEEVFRARELLELWTGRAVLRERGDNCADDAAVARTGREALLSGTKLAVAAENVENSRRPVLVEKAATAYRAYGQMLTWYIAQNLLDYLDAHPAATVPSMAADLAALREREWVNLGGQLLPAPALQQLISDIRAGVVGSWTQIHQRYDELWADYPRIKQQHALASLLDLHGGAALTPQLWEQFLQQALEAQEFVCEEVYRTRKKDYDQPFRRISCRNDAEFSAVMGRIEDNAFVKQVRQETERFRQRVAAVMRRW